MPVLCLFPPAPFSSLAPHWEASHKFFTLPRKSCSEDRQSLTVSTSFLNSIDAYSLCIMYILTLTSTDRHAQYTLNSIYQETQVQTWSDVFCTKPISHNIPHSPSRTFHVHPHTLSSSYLPETRNYIGVNCKKQQNRNNSVCILRAALYLPTQALATHLCSKMVAPTLWCSRVPCVKADQTLHVVLCDRTLAIANLC